MIIVQSEDFDVGEEYTRLRAAAADAGAIVTFTGLVREVYDPEQSDPSKISSLYLEHYPGMTEKCLNTIVDQANAQWRLLATSVIHRVGQLNPNDQIVFVGTASAHRQDALDAASFIMDYLKSDAPFWKKQSSERGSEWVESRESDAEAIAKWQQSVKP